MRENLQYFKLAPRFRAIYEAAKLEAPWWRKFVLHDSKFGRIQQQSEAEEAGGIF